MATTQSAKRGAALAVCFDRVLSSQKNGCNTPQETIMATITGVTISQHGAVIARAPSGEIAPPPDHQLTISGATWTGPRRNLVL
jgi:hypothetical protein